MTVLPRAQVTAAARPVAAEQTAVHSRLMKCALDVEESRAYWQHMNPGSTPTPQEIFDGYWFGARSLPRIKVLLLNLRARFDAFPPSLEVLHRWPSMAPDTRKVICHWHLQLADPLYREFTGRYLEARRERHRAEVTRDLVTRWVGEQGPERWTMSTRIQLASKLLSAARAAGLVTSARDPRPLAYPRVPDDALEYALYRLREVQHSGTPLDNLYLASVGLSGGVLEDRLRKLPGLSFRRQGDLVDFGWRHADLSAWGEANLGTGATSAAGAR